MTTITIDRKLLEEIVELFDDAISTRYPHEILRDIRSALAAPATAPAQPAWHDAPTVPGIWLCDEGDICYTWTAHNIEILDRFDPGDGLRWFGPIPPDGDKP